MACALKPALAEIHQQKGEIVEHVDGGEPVVELDGVEQDRRAVDLDDVAQMQIAVAVAHIAAPRPRLEQRRERGEPLAARRARSIAASRGNDVGIGGEGPAALSREHVGERRHGLVRREHPVGGGVEGGDGRSEARHRRQVEPPLACHAVKELRLVEAAHAQHPFDRLPLAAKPEGAAFAEGYREDLKIKLGRGAPVDAKLVQAGRAPLLKRRKVEKRVFDRPLHLVGEGAGQKNHGSMGLDTLYGCGGGVIASGRPMKSNTLAWRESASAMR